MRTPSWFELKPQRHGTNVVHLAFAFAFGLPRFTRVKCKRKRNCKRKEMKKIPFLALGLALAFALSFALLV